MANAYQPNAHPELERFVFGNDPFTADNIPRGLSAEIVTSFVAERIDSSVQLNALKQVEKLIEFYDAYEAANEVTFLLESPEIPLLNQVVIARILAKSDTTPNRKLAAQHYLRLVAEAKSVASLQELIGLYVELPNDVDAKALHARIDIRIQELQSEPESSTTRLDILDLKEKVSLALTRAEQAVKIKQNILGMTNRTERIREEVKMYLTLQYGYLEYLEPWAARRLRRETWGEHPENQDALTNTPERREDIIAIFRLLIDLLDSETTLSPEELTFIRLRALRAVDYFGGELSVGELAFLTSNASEHMDSLSK